MPLRTAAIVDAYAAANYGVPNDTMQNVMMTLCCEVNSKNQPTDFRVVPVVIFSPGLTNSRLQYNYHAASLASQGYAVVTINHAYDGIIVEYPDGHSVTGVDDPYWYPDPNDWLGSIELLDAAIGHRVADAHLVLQQLKHKNLVKKLIPGGNKISLLNTKCAAFTDIRSAGQPQ